MAVIEDNHGCTFVPFGFDSFVSLAGTGFLIHASIRPPKAAAPNGRVSIRLLVTNHEVFRRADDGAALEPFMAGESNPGNIERMRLVRVNSKKEAVIAVADAMRIECPFPANAIIEPAAFDGGIVENVGGN